MSNTPPYFTLFLFFIFIILFYYFILFFLFQRFTENCLSVAMQPSLLWIATVFFKITLNHYKTPCIVSFWQLPDDCFSWSMKLWVASKCFWPSSSLRIYIYIYTIYIYIYIHYIYTIYNIYTIYIIYKILLQIERVQATHNNHWGLKRFGRLI